MLCFSIFYRVFIKKYLNYLFLSQELCASSIYLISTVKYKYVKVRVKNEHNMIGALQNTLDTIPG